MGFLAQLSLEQSPAVLFCTSLAIGRVKQEKDLWDSGGREALHQPLFILTISSAEGHQMSSDPALGTEAVFT